MGGGGEGRGAYFWCFLLAVVQPLWIVLLIPLEAVRNLLTPPVVVDIHYSMNDIHNTNMHKVHM